MENRWAEKRQQTAPGLITESGQNYCKILFYC